MSAHLVSVDHNLPIVEKVTLSRSQRVHDPRFVPGHVPGMSNAACHFYHNANLPDVRELYSRTWARSATPGHQIAMY